MDLDQNFIQRQNENLSKKKKHFQGEWETKINVFITILYKLYLFDAIVLPGNLLHMWDKGKEAVTKGEIVMKKENKEFNSDEARVSEFSNTCW